ncbi:MAG: hypothetical protein IKY83_13400 [Proteobacteria bacterium]|nr:hypothetical protein [Pseudomonadota bacterium]
MKKVILTISLLLLFFTGLAADASAKDMSRRFGIGIDSTISEFAGDGRGISAVYNINKFFGLQAIFGLNVTKAEVINATANNAIVSGKYDTTIIRWNVSIRGLIPVWIASDVNLTAVVGFTASGTASDGFYSADEKWSKYNDGYQFSIDLGLRPEWWISDNFSIHTQVGIGIDIITDNGAALAVGLSKENENGYVSTNASGVSVDFFKNVDLMGMAGCTFWF